MKFKYPLTESQYRRFVDDPNTTGEIDNLARVLGTDVHQVPPLLAQVAMEWTFSGACKGRAELFSEPQGIVIDVFSKPWWLPWFVLDWGFRRALR